MNTMTETQIKNEIKRIHKEQMTLNDYIRCSRAGYTYKMNRGQRKEVYSRYIREVNSGVNKRTISRKASLAYDSITKHRDEVMYEGA